MPPAQGGERGARCALHLRAVKCSLFCPGSRVMGQIPPAARPRPFWGKSPVTVAVKRHSWGLFPPGLGLEASMRGCAQGCARGRGCTALPAGTGSQAGPLCPGALEAGKKGLILNCSRVRKRERLSLCPQGMEKPGPGGAVAPGALGTGGARLMGGEVMGTSGGGEMGTSSGREWGPVVLQ